MTAYPSRWLSHKSLLPRRPCLPYLKRTACYPGDDPMAILSKQAFQAVFDELVRYDSLIQTFQHHRLESICP